MKKIARQIGGVVLGLSGIVWIGIASSVNHVLTDQTKNSGLSECTLRYIDGRNEDNKMYQSRATIKSSVSRQVDPCRPKSVLQNL